MHALSEMQKQELTSGNSIADSVAHPYDFRVSLRVSSVSLFCVFTNLSAHTVY
jgi:hypothetical protein